MIALNLIEKKCVPCSVGSPKLSLAESKKLLKQLNPSWSIVDKEFLFLQREFEFKNFVQAIDFINKLALVCEAEGHHANFYLHDWKFVTVDLYTHKIKGLHENDFIVASKLDLIN